MDGTSLKQLAASYRLSYSDVSKRLKVWRTKNGLKKPTHRDVLDIATMKFLYDKEPSFPCRLY